MGERHSLAISEAADLFDGRRDRNAGRGGRTDRGRARAHFKTTSLYFQIDPARRADFEAEDRRNIERRGGGVRFKRPRS